MNNRVRNKTPALLLCLWALTCSGCMMASTDDGQEKPQASAAVAAEHTDTSKAVMATKDSFVCLKKMRPVRGFFVDNLLGKLDDTVAAAMSPQGATYPPGSVVQLVPTEAMIKHHPGWNKDTNDWEFLELKVSELGTEINVRGTTQVVNKFGGNCFECHQKSAPQWDLICEQDHGCDPLPIPDFIIRWTQRGDPRCD